MDKTKAPLFLILMIAVIVLAACNPNTAATTDENKLKVVATTTIVGDVVANIAGDNVDLTVLLPTGTDPHSFDPSPQDIAAVADADVLFANGAGLEVFMDNLLQNAGGDATLVEVSKNVDLLEFAGEMHESDGEGEAHEHEGVDPHVWFDPPKVIVWVDAIQAELRTLDPANAAAYAANAQSYTAELEDLDAWTKEQVAQIPAENRKLVTDHTAFGYFATHYGFEQVGAVFPGYSTLAQPSAQELAALGDAIGQYGIKAVFVGNTVNPGLAEQVARDSGVSVVFLYTGSLSQPDGDAPTYLDLMRYDVNAIVGALK